MTDRAVCVHGHFYQPPREDPWLEEVDLQPSAAPFPDWNERVTAECYRPFTAARVLAPDGRISSIVNLFSRCSFNVGPTLLTWLERRAPDVYAAVLEADREALARYGHGAALAQGYHHAILPLADPRDRVTEVAWGVRDFERRFDRPPEGFWLPELAVDVPTLEALAAHGIRFTVLAPHQAARVRVPGGAWREVDRLSLDLSRPYRCPLPSGDSIAVFFYDGATADALAFGDLLSNGSRFSDRLARGLSGEDRAQLVSVAVDGETFGHHRKFGEMALARALAELEGRHRLRVTVYGEFLEAHPPEREVQVRELTSWSCAHGVERWRADCGCATGTHPGWSQAWRPVLRRALQDLRDRLRPAFEAGAGPLLSDPWRARDAYIDLVRDPSGPAREAFFAAHAARPLSPGEEHLVLAHLELQRHLLMCFTSCGWFFDDIAGIEPVQVLRYAARACQLARHLSLPDPAPALVEALRGARGNTPAAPDGAAVWARQVAPAELDWPRLAAHLAVKALWADAPCAFREGPYAVACEACDRSADGDRLFAAGALGVEASRTLECRAFSFGVLVGPDGAARVGIGPPGSPVCPGPDRLAESFPDHLYGPEALGLRARRDLYERLMRRAADETTVTCAPLAAGRRPLLAALAPLGLVPPPSFAAPVALALEGEVLALLGSAPCDTARLAPAAAGLAPLAGLYDAPRLRRALEEALRGALERAAAGFPDPSPLAEFSRIVAAAGPLALQPDLWSLQNLYMATAQKYYSPMAADGRRGGDLPGPRERAWEARFARLAGFLGVRLP